MKMIKQTGEAGGLATLRRQLGFTQAEMADHLQVHRSTVKLAEQGQRSLPTTALLLVARLEIMLADRARHEHTTVHPSEEGAVQGFAKEYEALFERAAACDLQIHKLLKRLNLKKEHYQKIRNRLQIIEACLQEEAAAETNDRFWKQQRAAAIRALQLCGLPVQAMLRCRIMLLQAESGLYKHMKADLAKEFSCFFEAVSI